MHNSPNINNILISAGEASGDLHAANFIRAFKHRHAETRIFGMGGDLMRFAGAEIIVDIQGLALIGAIKIITNFFKIYNVYRKMKRAILKNRPDLVILVDYPGFNLRLAKIAKRAKIKVLYYISPKVWAWHQSRVYFIKKYVDVMAVIFPFEVDFYKKFAVPTVFVGNPLLDFVKATITAPDFKRKFNLHPEITTIGLLPGSRKGEIERLLPIMLQTAALLEKTLAKVQFVLPLAPSLTQKDLAPYLAPYTFDLHIIEDNTYNLVNCCDAAIVTSGTATLETALLAIPMVIIYKTSYIEGLIAKKLIKIPYIGLCNILANESVARELLQEDATPKKISEEVIKLLQNNFYRQSVIEKLRYIKTLLEGNNKQDIVTIVEKLGLEQ